MNPIYLQKRFKLGDTVRITTKIAVGVIGKITDIDVTNNGIEISGFKDTALLEQIDNAIEFESAVFSISDIKYIFKVSLNEQKPIIQDGTNDSKS